MKIVVMISLMSLVALSCSHTGIGIAKFEKGQVQQVVKDKEINWKDCPPHLPKGCKISVLEGNPKAPELFTVRFKVNSRFVMPAHTHPKDERVTILKGKVAVGFGNEAKLETATVFSPGDYYVNKRNEVHTVWGVKDSILQITGIGPWEAHFVKNEK